MWVAAQVSDQEFQPLTNASTMMSCCFTSQKPKATLYHLSPRLPLNLSTCPWGTHPLVFERMTWSCCIHGYVQPPPNNQATKTHSYWRLTIHTGIDPNSGSWIMPIDWHTGTPFWIHTKSVLCLTVMIQRRKTLTCCGDTASKVTTSFVPFYIREHTCLSRKLEKHLLICIFRRWSLYYCSNQLSDIPFSGLIIR